VAAAQKQFEIALSDNDYNDSRYAFRIALMQKAVSNRGTADQVIEFIRPGSELDQAISRVLLKEIEKRKYKPTAIVAEVQKKFPSFTMNDHTRLWKSADAKDPKKNFGCSLSDGQWYWYDTWLTYVLKHMEKQEAKASEY
jgi:hypothetical protein